MEYWWYIHGILLVYSWNIGGIIPSGNFTVCDLEAMVFKFDDKSHSKLQQIIGG